MGRFKYDMASDIDQWLLELGIIAPKYKHQPSRPRRKNFQHRFGELLPTFPAMRPGLTSPNRQHGIQE